jgi:hypothetical protein
MRICTSWTRPNLNCVWHGSVFTMCLAHGSVTPSSSSPFYTADPHAHRLPRRSPLRSGHSRFLSPPSSSPVRARRASSMFVQPPPRTPPPHRRGSGGPSLLTNYVGVVPPLRRCGPGVPLRLHVGASMFTPCDAPGFHQGSLTLMIWSNTLTLV